MTTLTLAELKKEIEEKRVATYTLKGQFNIGQISIGQLIESVTELSISNLTYNIKGKELIRRVEDHNERIEQAVKHLQRVAFLDLYTL